MQTQASITLRNVPAGADADTIIRQLSDTLQKVLGTKVRVNVTDNNAPEEFDRLNVLKSLNKGISHSNLNTTLPQDRDRINLYRG
jgi:hypothetical protein